MNWPFRKDQEMGAAKFISEKTDLAIAEVGGQGWRRVDYRGLPLPTLGQ